MRSEMCRGVAATLVALIGAQVTAARPIQKAVVVQQAGAYKGDVTDVRVVRRVESHSDGGGCGSLLSHSGSANIWWWRSAR